MARLLVVGSGAVGVHFAQTALDLGHDVEMLDVGFERPAAPFPDADFSTLKERLPDPEPWLLGEEGGAVVFPSANAKPYGFPPSKEYVFRTPGDRFAITQRAFFPMLSFARGGLAEAWTGGSYELRDEELADFPFGADDLRPHYDTVARRIGIGAAPDDLARFSPLTATYQPPLDLDAHSADILERYETRRERLHSIGAYIGRSRVALLSRDLGTRQACTHLGRCLTGCPRASLYAPSATLAELRHNARFTYRPGVYVRRLLEVGKRVVGVVAESLGSNSEFEARGDRVILAAGAIASSRIVLETRRARGEREPSLDGLMDNRHVMLPFVNLRRIGKAVELARYQFHQLALGIDNGDWRADVHGQITSLKAAAVHPVIPSLPFDMDTSIKVFRRIRGALGVANIWLADTRRPDNRLLLVQDVGGESRLALDYASDSVDMAATARAVATARRALRALGCFAPRGQVKILPRGSSVHYAGTIPMGSRDAEFTSQRDGSIRGLDGAHVADGAGFPWLPAKNITFTLMANATRIATEIG